MLSTSEIKRQMKDGNIVIENMMSDALRKPNSCSINMGNVLYVFDYDVVDAKEKNCYLNELISDNIHRLKRVVIPESGYLLEPHKVYLTKSVERIKTNGYTPAFYGRTAFSLLGLSTELNNGTKCDNYDGHIILSLIATKPTIIYPDMEIGNLTFFKSEEKAPYKTGMLSGEEIKKRMESKEVIIEQPDLIVINPNSVNLTLNHIIGYYPDPILDVKANNSIETMDLEFGDCFLYPDQVYLARTNEWTETENCIPMMSGRSSLGRNGLHVHCSAGMGAIGYKGYWHMGIRPKIPINVVNNMKCCQIYYYTIEGEVTHKYNGSMQNLSGDQLGSQLHRILKRNCK